MDHSDLTKTQEQLLDPEPAGEMKTTSVKYEIGSVKRHWTGARGQNWWSGKRRDKMVWDHFHIKQLGQKAKKSERSIFTQNNKKMDGRKTDQKARTN